MNPGTGKICRDCAHLVVELAEQGHVAPCERNCWAGAKHLEPAISEDGQRCSDYSAAEEPGDDDAANGAAAGEPIGT